MPPDRFLEDLTAGQPPDDGDTQQLVEAESGKGAQGINRRWQASNSALVVLTSDAAGVKISRDAGATPPTQVIVDGTAAGNGLTGTYPNPSLATASMDLLAPPGAIIAWAGPGAPAGWLPCDGRPLDPATYPRLYAAIGTMYGTGVAGTFRIPDLQGKVILSASGLHPLTTGGGQETVPSPVHTHPGSHSHGMNNHTHGPGVHTHGLNNHTHTYDHAHGLNGHTHAPGLHTHNTDINHDHPNALAAAGATATGSNSIPNGTGPGSTAAPATNHDHPVNLPALGTASVASGGPTANDTGQPSPASTPTLTPTATSVPTPQTLTGQPSADATAAATGSTETDPTAHNASYPAPGTIATLMPFLTLQYIIRAA